jgi:hypothetical protein
MFMRAEYDCIRTETLCAAHVFCFIYSWPRLWTTFGCFCTQTVTAQCSVTFSLVVFQPIPSLRLIYRSFLRTVVAVKCDNDDVEYTPPRND